MAKIKEFTLENMEEICTLAKALSSPVRVEIIKLLYKNNMIIGEIARILDIPQSSAAFHLKLLEKAGLIRMEEQPGSRGTMKLCSRKLDFANICLLDRNTNINEIISMEMPVGAFVDCRVIPTCGLYTTEGPVGMEDVEYSFYLPEKSQAGLLWTSGGYVEYRFANAIPKGRKPYSVSFSMEICSEAPGYREDWKSDITLWINGVECATWTCPGDYGARRGRLNPPVWPDGSTQYGNLVTWEVRSNGCYLNGDKISETAVEELNLTGESYIDLRIGNKEDAKYVGGFNLFGRTYGNYEQGIVMNIEY